MTTLEILKAAKAKIQDPANWTRRAYARDESGQSISPLSPKAVKFCALGAIEAVTPTSWLAVRLEAVSALCKATGDAAYKPVDVNDNGHHWNVMAMFDDAIANLEGRSGALVSEVQHKQ